MSEIKIKRMKRKRLPGEKSPKQSSWDLLKDHGYTVADGERVIPHSFIKCDLFGWADLAALREGRKATLYIQATTDTGGQMSKHLMKIQSLPSAVLALKCGNRIQIHAWAWRGVVGEIKKWSPRILNLKLVDGEITGQVVEVTSK